MLLGAELVIQEYFQPLAGQSTIIYRVPLKYCAAHGALR